MTSTTETPAPESVAPKRGMSEEQKKKMAEGRARAKAAREASPVLADAPKVDTSEEVAALRAEIEKLRKANGILSPEEVAALPTHEIYYEFVADKKTDRDEPIGEMIRSLDDPRWAELIALRRIIFGQVIVKEIVRAKSGEEINRIERACVNCKSPQQARDHMQNYLTNPATFHIVAGKD